MGGKVWMCWFGCLYLFVFRGWLFDVGWIYDVWDLMYEFGFGDFCFDCVLVGIDWLVFFYWFILFRGCVWWLLDVLWDWCIGWLLWVNWNWLLIELDFSWFVGGVDDFCCWWKLLFCWCVDNCFRIGELGFVGLFIGEMIISWWGVWKVLGWKFWFF